MKREAIAAILIALLAIGCDRDFDPTQGKDVTRIDFHDVKMNTDSTITSSGGIEKVMSCLASLSHGWSKYRVTLPMNNGAITLSCGTNGMGTVFIGPDWLSYRGMIRTTSHAEIQPLWETVSRKDNAQHASPP